MKLKSLLTAALMVCSTLTMSAEDFLHALKVERNDGTVDTYLFVDKPEVTFSGRNMHVTTPGVSTTYRLKEVKQWLFSEYSGIESVEADEVRFVGVAPGVIDIISLSPVGDVHVYDIQGRSVEAKVTTEDTTVRVDLTSLAPGIYILNTPNNSIKITR